MLHKHQIALYCVASDILSILIMLYVFKRLSALNEEYIDSIDENQITMKDFTVQLNNVMLDKYSQDIRIVKMKVWLHFTNIFNNEKFRLKGNSFEICDVNLSLSNQPETLQIFRMEETKN